MPVQNSEIAHTFYEIADLLEIEGANTFRVRAYRDAARTIEGYPKRINDMVESGESLDEIPGIGEDLAKKIDEMVRTSDLAFLETLRSRTPHSLLQLLDIPGLGPKRVQKLYRELHISNLEELQSALEAGSLVELEGFGEKTAKNISEAIKAGSKKQERTRLDIAEQFVEPLLEYLDGMEEVEQAVIAGSYRRRKATVGDLDILAISKSGKWVTERFVNYESVAEVLSQGETKASVRLRSGLQVDLRVVDKKSFGAALLYFTGSKAHNIHLRNLALEAGLKINEYGVYKKDERILGESEDEIYAQFGLPYIEPELREDTGEIEAAKNNSLPKLITISDIRGDLQMHTTESDGKYSLAEMAEAGQKMGYDYIAVTDHTSYIGVTQGLGEEDVDNYIKKIDAFNKDHEGITVLKGLEVDIHRDGHLDLPDKVLKKLDIVLGSVHSHFNLSEAEQTERIIRAMDNPYLNVLAHPTTRRIGSREPIALDLEKIMKKALDVGCFLEINASPERLDLWDQYIRLAGDLGLKLAISTDAHRKSSLSNMKYGVYQARRGWAEKSLILNTYPLDELRQTLKRH